MAKSQVKTFTSKGNAAPGLSGSGKLANAGTFDPVTGQVYQHPRLKSEQLTGGKVVVTNPASSMNKSRNARTKSLGMGGVGQRGRTRDL